jgi:hypothetical protein
MNRLVPGEGESENNPNGGELDDGPEGLIVVNSGTLGEAPKDPTCLVAIEGAIQDQLVAKNPLVSDHIGSWWTRHQVPGLVGQQGHVPLHSADASGCQRGRRE